MLHFSLSNLEDYRLNDEQQIEIIPSSKPDQQITHLVEVIARVRVLVKLVLLDHELVPSGWQGGLPGEYNEYLSLHARVNRM